MKNINFTIIVDLLDSDYCMEFVASSFPLCALRVDRWAEANGMKLVKSAKKQEAYRLLCHSVACNRFQKVYLAFPK